LVKKPVLAALALKMIDDGKVEVAEDQTLWQQVSKQLLELERQHYRALPLEPETFMPNDFAAASLLTEAVNNGVLIRDGGRLRLMHESVQECLGFQVCRRHPENIQSEQAIEMLGKARSIHFASYQILSSPFSRQIVRLMAVTAPNISRIAHRIAQLLFR
jgi:hypothetical protein